MGGGQVCANSGGTFLRLTETSGSWTIRITIRASM
jgi:hypothetical protein